MRELKIIVMAVTLIVIASLAYAGYVNGYVKKNGTVVDGYYRSDADGQKWNNYSNWKY
jgi:hypothetical protein